ncbi:MAG: hypothetical protein ACYCU6_12365, partial [Acidimicrobiales bacterium]
MLTHHVAVMLEERVGQQATWGKDGTERTGISPDFTGIAVHDRLIQYFGYDKATHALCCAHLVREALSVNPAPANRARDALEKESFNLAVAFRDRKADIVRFATDL